MAALSDAASRTRIAGPRHEHSPRPRASGRRGRHRVPRAAGGGRRGTRTRGCLAGAALAGCVCWPSQPPLLLAVVSLAWRRPAVRRPGSRCPAWRCCWGCRSPASAALSGPPLLRWRPRRSRGAGLVPARRCLPRLTLVPLCFALFVVAGGHASMRVGPQGDEPHYLMVAESLLRDGDLSLERTMRRAATRPFTTPRSRRTTACGGATARSSRCTRSGSPCSSCPPGRSQATPG